MGVLDYLLWNLELVEAGDKSSEGLVSELPLGCGAGGREFVRWG